MLFVENPKGNIRKKMAVFCVLDILIRHTDERHALKLFEIKKLLKEEHGVDLERKAVRGCIDDLIAFGFDVESPNPNDMPVRTSELTAYIWGEKRTPVRDAQGNPVTQKITVTSELHKDGWYLNRKPTGSEMRYVMELIAERGYLHSAQSQSLLKTLDNLTSNYYPMPLVPKRKAVSPDFFYNVSVLEEAIEKVNQVNFFVGSYGVDKKLHPTQNYTVDPYHLVVMDGFYYLLCHPITEDRLWVCRVDHIMNIQLLEEAAMPFEQISSHARQGMDLSTYLYKQAYRYVDGGITAVLQIDQSIVGDVLDTFGEEVSFEEKSNVITARIERTSLDRIVKFVLMNPTTITLLEPCLLTKRIYEYLSNVESKYK